MKNNLPLDYPLNLLYKLEYGKMEVKNNELIQNIILKKTILGVIFEWIFCRKKKDVQ